jgi:ubiquinone/menaquinone biosynthesis C-methylase UbiE
MSIQIDREQNELRALKDIGGWHDLRLLEIGCGKGRLTRRLARLGPASIEAIDPKVEDIAHARQVLPTSYAGHIRYSVMSAEQLTFPDSSFDRAVFSWVL